MEILQRMRLLVEHDLEVGMKRYTEPPDHGLIFYLQGRYRYITMVGVRFPLLVILYDVAGNEITRFKAWPGQDMIPIDPRTYTMVEIPLQ